MSDDFMRTHLITKLVCKRCASLLNMSYNEPDKKESIYSQDEPTGAANINSIITVYPCKCTLEDQKKLQTLKQVLDIK